MLVAANQRWSVQTVAVKLRFYCTESECNVHNMYQDLNSYLYRDFLQSYTNVSLFSSLKYVK